MVQLEFETPAKLALSVARDATTGSSGKDILRNYRKLVARKSAERLLSNESKESKCVLNTCSGVDTKISQQRLNKTSGNAEQVSGGRSRASQANGKEPEFHIYEENEKEIVKSQKENTNLLKHLVKESTEAPMLNERIALKPKSTNIPPIPCDNIRKGKPNALDIVAKNRSVQESPRELSNTTLSPINNNLTHQDISNVRSPQEDLKRISQGTSTSIDNSPQNFSTIEKNESIWFMAGCSPEMIANDEGESNSVGRNDIELPSTMHSSHTSIDRQKEINGEMSGHSEGSSYYDNKICTQEPFNTMENSIQSYSVDGRSFTTNSCAVEFSTPKPNASTVVSDCYTTETVSGATVFPTENDRWIEQTEDQILGMSNYSSTKKHSSCFSNEIAVENPNSSVSSSKTLAINLVGSTQTQGDPPADMLRLATASLIERNKTLVKEVRFVDQNCVELSERNEAMKRDIQRLESNITDLKEENESLHEAVVRSSYHSAKMETCRDTTELKMAEQKDHVAELKEEVESLTEKLEECQDEKKFVEMELASSIGKYEILSKNNAEARDKNSGLIERLASQSTSELASASTVESYRDLCTGIQKKVEELQRLADERLCTINKERYERIKIEEKLIELENKSNEFGNDNNSHKTEGSRGENCTPLKPTTESTLTNRTPTSTVLAKTLQSELKRSHYIADRSVEAEKIISVTQTKLKAVTKELYASKADAKHYRALLRNCNCGGVQLPNKNEINVSVYDIKEGSNESFHPNSTLVKCIAQTQSECEESKKKLNATMEEIRIFQHKIKGDYATKMLNEQTVRFNLLQALQQMADVCTAVNNSTNERAILYSRQIFDQCGSNAVDEEISRSFNNEEQSKDSSSSTNNTLMSPNAISKYTSAPSEIILDAKSTDVISPVTATRLSSSFHLSSMNTNTPLKITQFREGILNLQRQLDTANDEKDAVAIALSHACHELETLKQLAQLEEEESQSESNSNEVKAQYQHDISPMNKGMNDVRSAEIKRSPHETQKLSQQEGLCSNHELFDLREQLHKREEDITTLREKLKHIQHSKMMSESKSIALKEQLTVARQDIDHLGQELVSLKNQRTETLNTSDVDMKPNKHINITSESTYMDSMAQLDDLKLSYISSQERLAEEVERSSQLENVANDLGAKICSLEENLHAKSAQLSEANDRIDTANKKLLEAAHSENNLSQQYNNLQDELATLNTLRNDYETECFRRKEAECSVKKFRADMELATKAKNDIEQLLNSKISKLDCLRSEYNSLTEICKADKKVQGEQHCKLMEQLQIDIKNKTQELQLSESKLIDTHKQLQIQTNVSSEASEELKCLKANYKTASEHLCALENECADLRLKQDSMDRKNGKKREYIKKLTQRCEEWKAFYHKQEKDFCEAEKKYEDAELIISDLTEEVEALRKECLIGKNNISKTSKESQSNENAENNGSHSSFNICEECKYLRKAISKESSTVSRLKKDVVKKDDQIKTLTEQLSNRDESPDTQV